MAAKKPRRLYKYLGFSDRLLEQLCYDQVYYADPASFNDPLDCVPVVDPDMRPHDLETLLGHMVVKRSRKEITVALRKLRVRGDAAAAKREALSASEARRILGDINYNALNPDVEDRTAYLKQGLGAAINAELKKVHEVGVLCLSAQFNSPLMWSHYAEQHKGMCVEYDAGGAHSPQLYKVEYGESRVVKASQIRAWLVDGNQDAEKAVHRASLLTKAKQWSYEREWRLLGTLGLSPSPLHLKSVIFGMRCPNIIEFAVVKALSGRDPGLKFWRIAQPTDRFTLRRVPVDVEETLQGLPRTSLLHEFDVIADADLSFEK